MKKLEKFITDYYQLENDIFFNQFYNTGEAIFTFNEKIDNCIWNHAFPYNIKAILKGGSNDFVKNTITFFLSRNRRPAIYLDDRYFCGEMLDILEKNKFVRFDDEAWMEFKKINEENIPNIELQMLEIDDISKFNNFSKIIKECFDKEYAAELKRDFTKVYGFKQIKHFCYYEQGILIGCASIYYDNNTAHIHNVGVLKKYQGKGYGKVIVKYLFNYIKGNLKLPLILQCDGITVESFYKKLGAETFYRRYGYCMEYEEK